MSIKQKVTDAMKEAMRAREKERLGTIRLIQAEIKQIEVDKRVEVDDELLLILLDKMVKQRRDSIKQFEAGGRQELADKEQAEIRVIQEFLPAPLSEAELTSLISETIVATGAESMRDMGRVMGLIRPRIQGRADAGFVSGLVKKALS